MNRYTFELIFYSDKKCDLSVRGSSVQEAKFILLKELQFDKFFDTFLEQESRWQLSLVKVEYGV